jgi:hypothetical protein
LKRRTCCVSCLTQVMQELFFLPFKKTKLVVLRIPETCPVRFILSELWERWYTTFSHPGLLSIPGVKLKFLRVVGAQLENHCPKLDRAAGFRSRSFLDRHSFERVASSPWHPSCVTRVAICKQLLRRRSHFRIPLLPGHIVQSIKAAQ